MSTVKDANEMFAKQNLKISLPYPEDWIVKDIEILEKQDLPGGVNVLLGLKMINSDGKEISELYFSESDLKREPIYKSPKRQMRKNILPQRETSEFTSEKEAVEHLSAAMEGLLKEKGYELGKKEINLYGEKTGRGFYLNIIPRCDQEGLGKINELIELRGKYGDAHDYGLLIPAFQDSLGISQMIQEEWMSVHMNLFSKNHIGIFAVDNIDPNNIYPLTIYPKEKELRKYFIQSGSKWALLKSRYAASRTR